MLIEYLLQLIFISKIKDTYLQKAYAIYILKGIIYDSSLMVNIQEKWES